jgi:hypothetical protein
MSFIPLSGGVDATFLTAHGEAMKGLTPGQQTALEKVFKTRFLSEVRAGHVTAEEVVAVLVPFAKKIAKTQAKGTSLWKDLEVLLAGPDVPEMIRIDPTVVADDTHTDAGADDATHEERKPVPHVDTAAVVNVTNPLSDSASAVSSASSKRRASGVFGALSDGLGAAMAGAGSVFGLGSGAASSSGSSAAAPSVAPAPPTSSAVPAPSSGSAVPAPSSGSPASPAPLQTARDVLNGTKTVTETEFFDEVHAWIRQKLSFPSRLSFVFLPVLMYARALASFDASTRETEDALTGAIRTTLIGKPSVALTDAANLVTLAKGLHILDTLTSVLPRAGRTAFVSGLKFVTTSDESHAQGLMTNLATLLVTHLTKDAADPSRGMSPLDGRPFDAELGVEQERVTKSVAAFRKSLMERTKTMTSEEQRRHLRDILAATPSLLSAIGSATLPSVETPAGTPLKTYQSLGYNHNATKAAAPTAAGAHVTSTTIEGLL